MVYSLLLLKFGKSFIGLERLLMQSYLSYTLGNFASNNEPVCYKNHKQKTINHKLLSCLLQKNISPQLFVA